MRKTEVFFVSSPAGPLRVSLAEGRVYAISKAARQSAAGKTAPPLSLEAERIRSGIESMLSGRGRFPAVPLFERGTPFQRAVWRELQKIPRGETRSYGDIAQKIGRPKAARAVGGACAANPFLIAVPCHRATPKGGGPGGFALGLKAKRILLGAEKAPPEKIKARGPAPGPRSSASGSETADQSSYKSRPHTG